MNEEFAKFILSRNEFSNSGTAPILSLLKHSDRTSYPKKDFIYSPEHELKYVYIVEKSIIIRIPISDFIDIITADKALVLDFFRSFSYQICQFQRAELMENAHVKILNYLNWIAREHGTRNDAVFRFLEARHM